MYGRIKYERNDKFISFPLSSDILKKIGNNYLHILAQSVMCHQKLQHHYSYKFTVF